VDDYGQHDGDAAYGGSPFARSATEQPWLRQSDTPWKMWGGSQLIRTVTLGLGDAPIEATQQLAKVSYKRPDSWNFLFAAKIMGGSAVPGGGNGDLRVRFDLIVGLGRTFTILSAEAIGFENYQFLWTGPRAAPPQHLIYTTQVFGNNRTMDPAPALQRDNVIDHLVAQDIQANVVVTNVSDYAGSVDVEVSAYFAPRTHVRPDWLHPTGPLEQQFPGDEIGGR
jgi:hypothetical protein